MSDEAPRGEPLWQRQLRIVEALWFAVTIVGALFAILYRYNARLDYLEWAFSEHIRQTEKLIVQNDTRDEQQTKLLQDLSERQARIETKIDDVRERLKR